MKVQPKTLTGFMELLPNEQVLFNQMKASIQKSYEKFGFLPLDTPVIEMSEVLLAKAGGETEKQIYRFNKGDSDLALRFDLTVPLAKYVAEYYNDLPFPFRRYQIGKVYRGEKPQRGRFREFYQCDIDIIGDGELPIITDAEIPSVIYTTFQDLGFEDFTICINNRKILNGLFDSLDLNELSVDIMRIIDKIDKVGKDAVIGEIITLGVTQEAADTIIDFISIDGTTDEKIDALQKLSIDNETFTTGVKELIEVVMVFVPLVYQIISSRLILKSHVVWITIQVLYMKHSLTVIGKSEVYALVDVTKTLPNSTLTRNCRVLEFPSDSQDFFTS